MKLTRRIAQGASGSYFTTTWVPGLPFRLFGWETDGEYSTVRYTIRVKRSGAYRRGE